MEEHAALPSRTLEASRYLSYCGRGLSCTTDIFDDSIGGIPLVLRNPETSKTTLQFRASSVEILTVMLRHWSMSVSAILTTILWRTRLFANVFLKVSTFRECIVSVAFFLVAGFFLALVFLRGEDLCERGFWYGYGYASS